MGSAAEMEGLPFGSPALPTSVAIPGKAEYVDADVNEEGI